MKTEQNLHPDQVLACIVGSVKKRQKADNLKKIHELCFRIYAGSCDFSLSNISRIAFSEKIFKSKRTLYNAASADYRHLIEAWRNYAGSAAKPTLLKEFEPLQEIFEALLQVVPDYQQRILLQKIITEYRQIFYENKKLQAQLNMAASRAELVDIRSTTSKNSLFLKTKDLLSLNYSILPELVPIEMDSFIQAFSIKNMDRLGWTLSEGGAIHDRNGIELFKVGFVTAIKKILEALSKTQ